MKKINAANDYTAGERLGIGFQNILLGLGSYRNEHWGDGIFLTGSKLMVCYLGLTAEDDAELDFALGLGIASLAYGFVRPFYYHKNSNVKISMNVGAVQTSHGLEPGVSYKISW